MDFKEFNYTSLEQLVRDTGEYGLKLNFSNNLDVLKRKVDMEEFTIPNSLAIHPMEGCDGKPDGSPDELTFRRYERFSRGGAGLIWFEAVAVVPEGRASSRQLYINSRNVPEFKRLTESITANAHDEYGTDFTPLCIMQLTHSGRFSRPAGKPAPIIAFHDPYMDPKHNLDESYPVISDVELEQLEDRYVEAAVLAQEAGFHGVDIKACHRYLNSELLAGFTRKGRYGETFEGRTRFLLNIVEKVKARLKKDFVVAVRLNIYDGIPYPYGWGVDRENYMKYDLEEPKKLVKLLYEKGVRLVNLTMGTPYYNPHVNRPYDKGGYVPCEHPLEGVARLINGISEIKAAIPEMTVVGTGYSWLRHYSQYLAAGSIEEKWVDIVGYGREAFAYPEYARDIVKDGSMKKDKCCITCGKCAEILRAGGTTGCVIRDAKVYGPLYNYYCRK